jgi:transposase-like protein
MSGIDDLLLYPLMTEEPPVCPACAVPLTLVGFKGERGMPDFSKFRCPDCGRSETFADDDHAHNAEDQARIRRSRI